MHSFPIFFNNKQYIFNRFLGMLLVKNSISKNENIISEKKSTHIHSTLYPYNLKISNESLTSKNLKYSKYIKFYTNPVLNKFSKKIFLQFSS